MTAPANFYADFKGLAALKYSAGKEDPKALREVARQFESVFTQMMLKSMRDASLGESMMDSDQTKFYQDMFDNQMSMQLSRGKGLGLADLLVKQLTEAGLKSTAAIDSNSVNSKTSGASTSDGRTRALHMPTRADADAAASIVGSQDVPSALQVTKGGAEGGIKDIQGVTPSAPISSPVSASPINTISKVDAVNASPRADTRVDTRQALAQSPAEFIAKMWPHAQAAAAELGVDAKTLIAHAALETGWGKYVPCNPDGSCSFNLFGIKAGQSWRGNAVGVNTLEYENGTAVRRQESFRSYGTPADSFRDYAAMLKNSPRYENAVGSGNDTVKFANGLQQGGYATDPLYANKLTATAHSVINRASAALKTLAVQPLSPGSGVTSSTVSGDVIKTRQASAT